jgi:membrane protein
MRSAYQIMKATVEGFIKDNALQLAAAVAFYMVLSLVPIIILFLGLAGYIWEQSQAQAELIGQVRNLAGPETARAVETVIGKATLGAGRGVTAIVSAVTLVLGATGAFSQLQSSMNKIWGIPPRGGNPIRAYAHRRLLAVLMLLLLGFILLFAVVLSLGMQLLLQLFDGQLAGSTWALRALNSGSSLVVFTITFAAIFRVLPSARLAWGDVWLGAGVTAVLFTIGKEVISIVLARSRIAFAYGAAGSLVLLLLWVYYSCLIVFFGAELTGAYLRWQRLKAQTQPEAPPAGASQ